MPIDGLVSGLDTASIIDQLMALERAPQTKLAARRDTTQAAVDALDSIASRLSALRDSAGALQRSTGWNLRTATSSNPSALVATASAGATLGSLTFEVQQLATSHAVASGADIADQNTVIASGGSIQLTVGGETHDIDVGTGTLTEVVNAVNAAGIGVRAAVVSTGSGYRLQLSAAATGASGTFTVDAGLDPVAGGTVVTSAGGNARLLLGTGPGAYAIESTTNTFADVLPGVTLQARAVGTGPITVDVAADGQSLADKVQGLVDSANAVLSEIATRTAYDPTSKRAASLTGDAAVRRVAQSIMRAVSDAVSQATLGAPSKVGVGLDRYGKVTFDRAAFLDAYAKDPTAVERMFAQGATTTGDLRFIGAGDRTRAGSREVVVTALATQASSVGLVGAWPAGFPGGGPTVRVRVGATEASYTILDTDGEAEVVAGLQAAINAAGLSLTVGQSGGGIEVRTVGVGSSSFVETAWDGTSWVAATGTNVAGTVDGVAATGTGNILTVPATNTEFGGLAVEFTGTATGVAGTVDFEGGIAQRIAAAVAAALDPASGFITSATETRQNRIDELNRSIDAYEVRLLKREALLRKQYTNLETALGNLRDQGNWLAGQLATLTNLAAGSKPTS